MKKTMTILLAALIMTGFASCMYAGDYANHNPMAVRSAAVR